MKLDGVGFRCVFSSLNPKKKTWERKGHVHTHTQAKEYKSREEYVRHAAERKPPPQWEETRKPYGPSSSSVFLSCSEKHCIHILMTGKEITLSFRPQRVWIAAAKYKFCSRSEISIFERTGIQMLPYHLSAKLIDPSTQVFRFRLRSCIKKKTSNVAVAFLPHPGNPRSVISSGFFFFFFLRVLAGKLCATQ